MNGILTQKGFGTENDLYRVKESVRGEGDPPVEPPGSDWTPLLSQLLLREEPECSWIQNQP